MDAGDEALVGDEEESEAGRLVDAAAFGFDDAVFDLVGHAETVAATDAVGFEHEGYGVGVFGAVEGDGETFFEADGDLFEFDGDVVAPEGGAHDGGDDLHAGGEEFEVLGFVGGAEDVGVGGVGLLGGHLVAEAGLGHEGGHLGAAAQLVDEGGVEPGLVDLEVGVDEEAVAVEALDVVAFEGGAVAPDVDVVFLHGGDEHGAGDGAADGGGVEVGDAGGGDVEGAGLEGGDAFADEGAAAVNETGFFSAVLEGFAWNLVVGRLRRAGRGWRCRRRGERPSASSSGGAALVSRPPEKAMPTFCPRGRVSRITDILCETSLGLCLGQAIGHQQRIANNRSTHIVSRQRDHLLHKISAPFFLCSMISVMPWTVIGT